MVSDAHLALFVVSSSAYGGCNCNAWRRGRSNRCDMFLCRRMDSRKNVRLKMTQKRYNNRYIGRVLIDGRIVNVGTFDDRGRALIAEKLARYWHLKGFKVPSQPRMVDAI